MPKSGQGSRLTLTSTNENEAFVSHSSSPPNQQSTREVGVKKTKKTHDSQTSQEGGGSFFLSAHLILLHVWSLPSSPVG